MRKTLMVVTAASISLFMGSVWAAGIKLYSQPDTKAKVASEVPKGQRLIPIYQSPQHRGWLKVANPHDGSVGWMRLLPPKTKAPMAKPVKGHMPIDQPPVANQFSQRVVTTQEPGKAPQSYRVIEYSGPEKLSKQQLADVIARMEQRQQRLQQDMRRMMDNMQRDFFSFQPMALPTVEHVVVVPVAESTEKAAPLNQPEPEKKSFWKKLKDKLP
jgi:hypothetical protein